MSTPGDDPPTNHSDGVDDGAWGEDALRLVAAIVLAVAVVLATALARRLWAGGERVPPGLRARAGCVPIRVAPSGRLHLLLIRSRKHPEVFTFPAGSVERGETAAQAAARETLEEAGVTGRLGRRLAAVSDGKAHTTLFALHVEDERAHWDEADQRERQWFDLGVPGSPGSEPAAVRAREALSTKPYVRELYERVQPQFQALAQECEKQERAWGRSRSRRADDGTLPRRAG